MSRQSVLSSNRNHPNQHWSFLQVKGTLEGEFSDADMISCVEFNSTGKLLACGDKGGRIVIFQTIEDKKSNEYDLYCTFQSHEAEFDYLKSLEIEEKINKICWLDESKTAASHFMLTTNDKTIKLWKLSERDKRIDDSVPNVLKNLYDCDTNNELFGHSELRVPKILPIEPTIQSNLRRIFSNAHTFHINSVSINSDQETFISADELRINLWNLEVTDESFVIVDIKPSNMEDLTEVINVAEFHPQHCHIFAYSTSKGSIKLCDMREAALCDHYSKIFQDTSGDNSTNFFYDLTSVISDLKFSHSGRFMITRDYMTLKVWDINMERQPLETYHVHEYLRGKLCSLYENDYIFDKFECSLSGNDNFIMTGSYNLFKIIDRETKQESLFEINKDVIRQKYLRPQRVVAMADSFRKKPKKDEIFVENIDLNRRICYTAWNPSKNLIADIIIIKLIFLDEVKSDKFIYVTWNGTRNCTEDSIFLDRNFAIKSNIKDNELILVQVVDDQSRLGPCTTCYLKPVTENDFQLITINSEEIENELLNQIRIVTSAFLKRNEFNIFPLWLRSSPNVPIFVKICKVEPMNKTGLIITSDTKVVILPLHENIQDDEPRKSVAVESSNSSLKSVFGLFRSLIPNTENVLPSSNAANLTNPIEKYVSVPEYRGKPLFLRLVLIKETINNSMTAFISPTHFENLRKMNCKKNYCIIRLRRICETSSNQNNNLNIDSFNFDTTSMSIEEKYSVLFVDKFFKMHEYLNEKYLLVVANENCPEDSIMLTRWLLVQHSLPFLSYAFLDEFDPNQTSLPIDKIENVNYLLVPIVKHIYLISLKLFDKNDEALTLKIEKEFKQMITDNGKSSESKPLLLWNGFIMNIYNDNQFLILHHQAPPPNLELEISRSLSTCFIIDHHTKFSIQQVPISLNVSISNHLNKLSKNHQMIDSLCLNKNVLAKPFAGRDDTLQECLQFIHHSLNLRPGIPNESSYLFTSLLITGSKGSGKTTLVERILYDCFKNYSVWYAMVQCSLVKGKRIESLQKSWVKLFSEAIQHQPSILVFEDLHQIAYETNDAVKNSLDVDTDDFKQSTTESFYCERVSYIFCQLIDSLRRLKSISTFSHVSIITTSGSYLNLNMLIQKSNVFDQIVDIHDLNSKRKIKVIKEIFDKKDYSLPTKGSKIETSVNIDMKRMSQMTKNFTVQQLNNLIDMIIHSALVSSLSAQRENISNIVVNIDDEHLQIALAKMNFYFAKKNHLKLNTKRFLRDVGGMYKVKEVISDLILLQIKHPSLHRHLPLKLPNSLLLYGMPGTGKTLIVEALANESGLNFLSVKGPELLSKYIGNSEQSVRRIFRQAQEVAPCILFFDEFDSLAPRRGHDSTGVTDRVVNQMLTLMDGLEERKHNIFIIAASSRPDLIDLALLRPGRFDQTVLCDLPNEDERKEILMVLSQKLLFDVDSIPFNQLVKSTENFSGADLQALLYNAFLDASKKAASSCHQVATTCITNNTDEQLLIKNKVRVSIDWQNIQKALNITKPSLSEQERNRFIRIYNKFETELSGRIVANNPTKNNNQNEVITLA